MIQVGARTTVDDMMLLHAVSKRDLDARIVDDLAHSLAQELIKNEEYVKTMVKRVSYMPGATDYEARVCLISLEEARELKELRKFKAKMENIVLERL